MRASTAFRVGVAALALALVGGAGSRADTTPVLISDLSDRHIEIGSDFAGSDILVFGAVAPHQRLPQHIAPNQIVVVLEGEGRSETVRRKARVAGIWVNREALTFTRVPSVYALASTGPLDTIAPAPVLQREEIGLSNLSLPFVMGPGTDMRDIATFRAALIGRRIKAGLFHESEGAVTLIGGALFRGSLRVPATIPTGHYTVSIYLLRDGRIIARNALPLKVDRAGIERRISRLAQHRPLLYGLLAVLWALSAGWLGAVVLRDR